MQNENKATKLLNEEKKPTLISKMTHDTSCPNIHKGNAL
jgi:hypothetical protein